MSIMDFQLWIVNYYIKKFAKNLRNQNNLFFCCCLQHKTWITMPKWTIFVISFLWKHEYFCFHYWDYLTNFWCNNWQSIIDVVANQNKNHQRSPIPQTNMACRELLFGSTLLTTGSNGYIELILIRCES